jgi:hypothetical protein
VLGLTCFTSTFHDPGSVTLDEALVRHPTGGAVATWGATGLGLATGHHDLAAGFLENTYGAGQPELGPAILAGKLLLATQNTAPDLLDTFTLLGDPAQRLHLTITPWAHTLYLPVLGR